MRVKKYFTKVAVTLAVIMTPVFAAEDFFNDLPEVTTPPPVEAKSKLEIFFKKEMTEEKVVAQLKQLIRKQKRFFKKYLSGIVDSSKEVAEFKVDLALLEFNVVKVLAEVDAYIAKNETSKPIDPDTELSELDKALEEEESLRTRIQTLVSEMKLRRDRTWHKHKLMFEIPINKNPK